MKKIQVKTAKIAVLGYSAALAVMGSAISLDAAADSCTDGGAASPLTCSFGTGAALPWAESWSFTGSNNVSMNLTGSLVNFGACASHNDGRKSFGLTLTGGSMIIRDAKSKAADLTSGCAA